MLSRRGVVKLGAFAAAGAAIPGSPLLLTRRAHADVVVPPPFTVPMALPPVAVPALRTATTDYYNMTIRNATAEIIPGCATKVMGYDGSFPGPTIRAWTDRRVVVRQTNELSKDSIVHLHGAIVPTSQDGYPSDVIAPGGNRYYHYVNRQQSATLWYHDHTMHLDAEKVFRGLAGFYLLDDPKERHLRLPGGRYDIPLMLRDARFDGQGQLLFEMDDFRYRNTLLVNGKPQPYLRVDGRKYRLRLLNGSNERYFTLSLGDGSPMTVIASDDGLLPEPLPATEITLSPAERVDVIVDFGRYAPGTSVVLRNTHRTAGPTTSQVMRFDVGSGVHDHSRVPHHLGRRLELGHATRTRDITMGLNLKTGRFEIDGKLFDINRIDQRIKRGETEIWTIHNTDVKPSVPHNMHLHGTHFQVLDMNGTPVAGHYTGPKDTVPIPMGGYTRIKVRYDRYLGRYLYHCHLLDHAAMGMMAQSQIVA